MQLQKNKKLEFETFLYQTSEGTIDTKIAVVPYLGVIRLEKGEGVQETIGTLELRLYITRQFGFEHSIDSAQKYDSIKDGSDAITQVAVYKDVKPQLQMTFEENCPILETSKASREKSKINKKRPGSEPWTIFRFHYRSEGEFPDLN